MTGYLLSENSNGFGNLEPWEWKILEAIGQVIDFWGFKRNHGKIWGLLFLRNTPMKATEIQQALGLSKGAVSMILRELEGWDVIRRVRIPSSNQWCFVAETNIPQMVKKVMEERESTLVSRVLEDINSGKKEALTHNVDKEVIHRIEKLEKLANTIARLLQICLQNPFWEEEDFEETLLPLLETFVTQILSRLGGKGPSPKKPK
ncbi:MAG: transcriptional regulator [Planctomycetota bacterium]|nr:MAG: transcriptional regulator [Planctomycetota bacterium]